MNQHFDIEGIRKATATVNQSVEEKTIRSISSEPLNKYIIELKEELRSEMAGISDIKW